jgi:site-specific recombinase XerD
MQSQNRFNYAAIHKGLKNHILRYNRQRDVHFLDLNLEFLKGFDEHLSAHGLRPSGILVVMRTFKTTLNLAKKEQLVPTDYNPFAGIDFAKYTKEKPQKRALSRTVIQQIEAENCEFDPKIQFARDIFLFSYYCAGINFGDIARLTDVNLSSDGRLQYRRQKTGDQFDIKLLQPALEIIEKHRIPGSQHLFPIILKQHNTPAKQHTRIQGMLRSVNADLKRLAAHLDIKDDLTTYYARHSFATNLKHAGISTAIISQALGHESERVTQVYLDSFDTSVMDAAISNILVPSDK